MDVQEIILRTISPFISARANDEQITKERELWRAHPPVVIITVTSFLSASDLRSVPDSGITRVSFPQCLRSRDPGSADPAGVSNVPFTPCGLTWSGVIHRWSCSWLVFLWLWSLVSESAGLIAYRWWICGAMRQSCLFVSTATALSYTN